MRLFTLLFCFTFLTTALSAQNIALKGVPVMEATVPPGVVNVGGEWFYEEYSRNAGVANVGLENRPTPSSTVAPQAPPPPEERGRILDLFRN